jgi:hypothetical protein
MNELNRNEDEDDKKNIILECDVVVRNKSLHHLFYVSSSRVGTPLLLLGRTNGRTDGRTYGRVNLLPSVRSEHVGTRWADS